MKLRCVIKAERNINIRISQLDLVMRGSLSIPKEDFKRITQALMYDLISFREINEGKEHPSSRFLSQCVDYMHSGEL